MTWFSARNISVSTVPAAHEELWQLITDPDTLANLTPLIRSIEAPGSTWTCTLNGVEALGLRVEAEFTERMEFTDHRQIVFSHDPPAAEREWAGVAGIYDFDPVDDHTTGLKVDLTLSVDLPLPRLSRAAVEPIILSTMRITGQKFASNLYELLGLDPSTATITEVAPPR